VPRLLEDELLYSFLARLAAYNANSNPRAYLRMIFGTQNIIPSVDLPASLDQLQHRLGLHSPYDSVEAMIDTGTIYPYHRPFLAPERHDRIHEAILHGGAKGLKTLLGRVANRFGANPPLRYCAICLEVDASRDGAPYWHRIHQLPGVTVCAIHRVSLLVHLWPTESTDRQRLHLVPATQNLSLAPATQMAIWFAEISRDFLQMNLPVLQIPRWHLAYETAVAHRGLLDSNGRIQFHDFAAELRNHYRDFVDFQHHERILSTPKHPLGWLHTVFERPTRSSHPIFHLLLIGFLFGTIKAFVHALPDPDEVESVAKEEGHTEDPRILSMDPTDDALHRNSSISSRQIARILKVSVDTVVSRRRAMGVNIGERRKVLHPSMLRSMEKALAKGGSPSSIAKRFGVSLTTVYRIRRESLPLLEAHKRVREQEERRKRRLQWQRAVKSSAGMTVTAIRKRQPALYAWLYRHDKAWLLLSINHHSANPQRAASTTIVDWGARDQKLSEQLKAHYNALRTQADRERISRTKLIRPLGEAMVRKHLRQLPQVSRLLESLVESPEMFQRFRIDRAIAQLQSQGLPLMSWRIQRSAGIRVWNDSAWTYALERIKEEQMEE
jgi:hypothetical protein